MTLEFNGNASPAVLFVQEGHNTFLSKTETMLARTEEHVTSLSRFAVSHTPVTVSFDFNAQLTPFQRPVAPVLDSAAFNLRPQEQPGLPETFSPQTPDIGAPPVFDVDAPVIAFGPKPTSPDIQRPTAPARPAPLVFPDEPDYASRIPEPVTLLSLNMPVFPTLNLPEFTAQRPTIEPFNFNDSFGFTPQAYVSTLLAKLQSRVSTWMDGQEALPIAIQRALFDRGRSQVQVEVAAEIESAYDDFSTRGFSAPQAMLTARIDAIRQKGQDRNADYSRETTIKAFDEALANMRMAVTSGIQLEGMAINLHMEEQRLLLASASYLRDTAIAVLNARIGQFNAEMQGYQIDAGVLETRLKIELGKLEETRLRMEGEKLRGDVNEQTIRQYTAQWEGVKTLADFYKTQLEGVKVQADVARIPIEIFSDECKAFETLWGAHAKEWDGYRASVEGETSKVAMHRNLVEAFSVRSSSAVQHGGLQIDREKLRIAEHQQSLESYGMQLKRLDSLLEAERARLGAVGQKAGAEATIYRARADVEQVASAATDRSFELGLAEANSRKDAQLETAKIRSSENIAMHGLILEALKALTAVSSQIAASTMSAVNYSANVSASDGFSHSRSVGWSGEAQDWDPSYI